MNLIDIGKKIAEIGAPLLGTLLGGPAGGILGGLVSHALGGDGSPDPAKLSALIDQNPEHAKIVLQKLQNDNSEYLAELQALQTQATQTGQTMRVEYGSTDAYVRRWRPTWGYVSAGAWALEAMAIFAAVIIAAVIGLQGKVDVATKILSGVTTLVYALAALWSIALAVLGVNIVQRSKDKRSQTGQPSEPSLMAALKK